MSRTTFLLSVLLGISAIGCFSVGLNDHTVLCHANAPACPDGYFCRADGYCYENGHTPPVPDMTAATKNAGDACTFSGECITGYCVDGVCCSTDCSDSCNACNVPGKEGTCSPLPNGQTPATNHPACGPDPTRTCGRDGSCDGKGFCRKYDIQTVCKVSSCDVASNLFTAESTCDGQGNCISPASITCEPFVCKPDMTACYPTCTPSGNECSAGNVCTNGSCGLKVDGSTCAADTECKSDECIDDVCCHTSCDGQCQACDLTTSRGTCATVPSGQPHSSHPACITSNVTCAGACAGNPSACTYPDTSTICQGQSCSSAVVTYAKKCDGAGGCVAPNPATLTCSAPPANGSASCNGASCGISCNTYYGPDQSGTQCIPVWTKEASFAGDGLVGVWGSSATDVYAISNKNIYHSTGNGTWTKIFSISSSSIWSMSSIWGAAGGQDVWAVGPGTIYHSANAGSTWTNEWSVPTPYVLYAVAGDTSSNPQVFAVGEKVYSRNGTTWNEVSQTLPSRLSSITWELGLGTIFVAGGLDGNIYKSDFSGIFAKVYATGFSQVNGVWGSGADYYVVGAGGGIVHGDRNNNWGAPAQSSGTSNTLRSVYGVSDSQLMTFNYYAVGDSGTIVFSTGNGSWSAQTSNTAAALRAVWGSGLNDIYAVGYDSGASAGVVMRLR